MVSLLSSMRRGGVHLLGRRHCGLIVALIFDDCLRAAVVFIATAFRNCSLCVAMVFIDFEFFAPVFMKASLHRIGFVAVIYASKKFLSLS